jgi:acyl-[acyl-carrier-protein]-phospholipid O-acyltransferase / long-chain-fatty-acid--[acyl-carrier-protein] ligase
MRSPLVQLLTARRFAPLFFTQFLGAFNDNLLKSALAILVTYRLADRSGMDAASLAMLASALFIAPFFLFSGASGTLSDRYDKALIARWVKVVEIGIMALGAWGLWRGSVPVLLAALFTLGLHSTVFGPIKYALLPQHLRDEELVAGNALIEAGTFLAILFGTILGGAIALVENGAIFVGICGLVAAASGWLAARQIPAAPPSFDGAPPRIRLLHDTIDVVRHVASRPNLLLPILATSWFWLFGLIVVSGLPVFAKDVLFANEQVVTMMLALFAVGVGLGSILAEKLLHGEVSARFVPWSACAMALFAIDLHLSSARVLETTNLAGIVAFLNRPGSWRIVVDLVGVAVAGGLFTVPLYAILQHESEPSHRARVIAANNIINALAMTVATVAAGILSRRLTMGELFAVCGFTTLPVAAYAGWVVRRPLAKSVMRVVLRILYRVDVEGLEHARAAMPHAVIAANHASFLDGLLLGAFMPGDPIFAVDTHIAKQWWAKPFLCLVNAFPVDPTNPLSIRSMIRAVDAGSACIIFPEGRVTTTGALMKVYEGPAVIAERTKAALVLIRIEGAEFTPFSRLAGKVRQRWFPRLRIRILPARRLTSAEGMTGRARRAALRRALRDEMVQTMFATAEIDTTLFDALLDARQVHGGGHAIADDIEFRPLTYRGLVTASLALGGVLAKRTTRGERVGVLLPTSRAAVVSFFALQAEGRVPAMLNFSTGPAAAQSACRAAEIALVITARRFVEKAKLEPLVAAIASQATVLYLEDVRAEIGIGTRVGALLRSLVARPHRQRAQRANEPAVVLFTSGSEGTPKGVVLSHRNLLANRHQLGCVVDFSPKDIVFNALPVFHSFGLTGGLLLPLLAGVRVFLYPSPLHYRTVPELAYGVNATILFGTDTFLAGYARVADNYDFYSVRYVFAGAERVKAETRRVWSEKFGIRILEGYGTTETAPALAVNTPIHFKAGTVGRLLPGLTHRLDTVEGIADGGRLFVTGPNVMLGYLRAENPGVLEPPPNGWYDTGDIVQFDAEGFLTIKGRAKRFAKVAGEMVPLGAVEELVSRLWPSAMHAVVTVPDAKRGEMLVLITDQDGASRGAIASAAREAGLPEIFVPRSIAHVSNVPLLGTGKIDYVSAGKLAVELAQAV